MSEHQSERCPPQMKENRVEQFFKVSDDKLDEVWRRLNCRETFVDGQIFPYKVEFDSQSQRGPFSEGELNIHHGPMLSVHGKIGEVRSDYRSLEYFYGSYVLSFRLVRPRLLEFHRVDGGLRLKLNSHVATWFEPFWNLGNRWFWKYFGISFLIKEQ